MRMFVFVACHTHFGANELVRLLVRSIQKVLCEAAIPHFILESLCALSFWGSPWLFTTGLVEIAYRQAGMELFAVTHSQPMWQGLSTSSQPDHDPYMAPMLDDGAATPVALQDSFLAGMEGFYNSLGSAFALPMKGVH